MNKSKYAGILYDDIANGTGFGATLFFQGCPHHCPGCHNPNTWNFDDGKELTPETINDLLEYFEDRFYANRLSISGGEPLANENANKIYTHFITHEFKKLYPNHKVWLWTGYRFEDLTDAQKVCLQYVDILIDGPFIQSKKDLTLPFHGSKNQRILDCQLSLQAGHPILHKEYM